MLNDLDKPLDGGSYFSSCGAMGLCAGVAYACGLPVGEVDGFKAFELIKAGNPAANAVFQTVIRRLAGQVYNMTTLLDLDAVAIGGGISREPLLIDSLKAAVQEHIDKNPTAPYSAFYPHPVVRGLQIPQRGEHGGGALPPLKAAGQARIKCSWN